MMMMRANRFLSGPRLRAKLICHTGRCLSVVSPYHHKPPLLLRDFTRTAWHDTLVWHRRQWTRRHLCLRHPSLVTLYLHWRVRIEVVSHRWISLGLQAVGWEAHWYLDAGINMVISVHLSSHGLDFINFQKVEITPMENVSTKYLV